MIPVVVVDRVPLFRLGLCGVLQDHGYEVLASNSLNDALDRHGDSLAVLISVHQPTGAAALAKIVAGDHNPAVIALVEDGDVEGTRSALRAGADTVVSRRADPERIVASVEALVTRDEAVLPSGVVRALAGGLDEYDPSHRELSWLRGLDAGLTVDRLARKAGYSTRHMHRLLRDLYQRLGVADRRAAVTLAHERGWLTGVQQQTD